MGDIIPRSVTCTMSVAAAADFTCRVPSQRRFMRQLVEARSQSGSSKMRRTAGAAAVAPAQPPQQQQEQDAAAPAAAGAAGAAPAAADRPPAPSRRGEDFDAAARVAMELATSFMFRVSS